MGPDPGTPGHTSTYPTINMQILAQKQKQHEIQDKNPKLTNAVIMDSNKDDFEELPDREKKIERVIIKNRKPKARPL